jgi:hypothetical protein
MSQLCESLPLDTRKHRSRLSDRRCPQTVLLFLVCRYANAISSCRPQFRLNLYIVKIAVLIGSQWVKSFLHACWLPMPGKRHRKIYARRCARSRIKHMLVSEMHEVSVTPLSDCTVLTRSTRIRREASALHAAIRKKRGF